MKADFAMAMHFHQPVGNFDSVIERASDKCYIPFLKTLMKYPEIKMTVHFTGCLLEWAEGHRPEIVDMVREMSKTGQVEVMSGGFYEPILPSIPPADRLRQINMLTDYVKDKFSCDPKGAWVAERVWEPSLPSLFYDAGIKYVILDDTHFIYSGITKDKTYGYYVTEDNAKPVAAFPSDKILRYHIPYKMPHECMDYMRHVFHNNNDAIFVYGDDGEKFGEWPGTHKWVFKEKWLEKFFDEIMKNTDWLNTATLSECLEKRPPIGKVYLQTTSYEEMLEWALPADRQQQLEDVIGDLKHTGKEDFYKPFIRGGFWRNFLSKYPESDNMNKKMIYLSNKLEALRKDEKISKKDIECAEKELFKGQCNCAYWHGVFGGLYLFHLRRSIYHHLVKSETLIDNMRYGTKEFCEFDVADIDADGADEVVLSNKNISLYFDPSDGGILKEMDSKTICQNLINSLSRRKEAYHRKIVEKIHAGQSDESGEVKTIHDGIQVVAPGIEYNLHYDWYGRYSLVDHFLGTDVEINSFSNCAYDEIGDFVKGAYDFEVKEIANGVTLLMKREGIAGGNKIYLEKMVTLPKKGTSFTIQYTIENREEHFVDLIFAPEFNITMPDADSEEYSIVVDSNKKTGKLKNAIKYKDVQDIGIRHKNDKFSVNMTVSEKCRIWHFPVNTVSQSEKAYELNYQSSVILPQIDLKLDAGSQRQFTIEVDLTD